MTCDTQKKECVCIVPDKKYIVTCNEGNKSFCVNLRTNTKHCGNCGTICEDEKSCINGSCIVVCPTGKVSCDETCADLKTDPSNCGLCSNICDDGRVCIDGTCTLLCPNGLTNCGEECVDTKKDPLHCGKCSNACLSAANTCLEGQCTCPNKGLFCEGTCLLEGLNCVSTFAGSGQQGFVDGPANQARLNAPQDVTFDRQGGLYVADTGNHRIRKLDAIGQTTTVAGDGQAGFTDGPAAQARFSSPRGVVVDSKGDLYIADTGNHRIRKLDTSGNITTVAGDGQAGFADGPANQARFNAPSKLLFDHQGALYVADTGNHRIRKIDTSGNVTPLAGDGTRGFLDGPANQARFNIPEAMAFDAQGNLYIADTGNYRIRKLDSTGNITTFAGRDTRGLQDGPLDRALFYQPVGIAIDPSGKFYVSEAANQKLRIIQLLQ
ncbi:MAG: hypothetical protein H6728_17560 [Myxococcales bacterium]|nr:hypothetical protein [Myxococcales bacterium]